MRFNIGDLFVFNEDNSIAYIDASQSESFSITYGPGDTWQSSEKLLYYTLNIPIRNLNKRLIYTESELNLLVNSNNVKYYPVKQQ